MFEKATRLKLRFSTSKGLLSVEDVWDLSLENLDTLAKALNKQVKESSEESFIKTRTNANKELELKFEVVKHIIKTRLEEDEKEKDAAEKRRKRAHILELIAQKEDESLSAKGIEDLKKELAELEEAI